MVRPFVIVLLLGTLGGCASVSSSHQADGARGQQGSDSALPPLDLLADNAYARGSDGQPDPAVPPRLPAPQTAAEAQWFLQGSVAALRAHEPSHAALFLDAILRSDHLTDRGRANVYWMLAEAHRQTADDEELLNAMGGFLVAASVVPEDADITERTGQARATLAAARIRVSPGFGVTPRQPIRLEGRDDVGNVVEQLACGPRRDMPYVDRRADRRTEHHPDARVLEAHTLTCSDDGQTVTLWFDLTEVD